MDAAAITNPHRTNFSCSLPCSSTPTLQSLCIYSLANTEAGQAVVNIMGVGVDTIDMVIAAQPSRYD